MGQGIMTLFTVHVEKNLCQVLVIIYQARTVWVDCLWLRSLTDGDTVRMPTREGF